MNLNKPTKPTTYCPNCGELVWADECNYRSVIKKLGDYILNATNAIF